jgi:hypothetical protein
MATRNAIIRELTDIGREIKRRDMLARLLPFLDDVDASARFTAAEGCLRIAPEKAVATLEALADEADADTRAAAGWALQRWRRGECYVDQW